MIQPGECYPAVPAPATARWPSWSAWVRWPRRPATGLARAAAGRRTGSGLVPIALHCAAGCAWGALSARGARTERRGLSSPSPLLLRFYPFSTTERPLSAPAPAYEFGPTNVYGRVTVTNVRIWAISPCSGPGAKPTYSAESLRCSAHSSGTQPMRAMTVTDPPLPASNVSTRSGASSESRSTRATYDALIRSAAASSATDA
jgi:hypothetical protein